MPIYALVCIIVYVSFQLLSNIASIKIGYVFHYAVDMGVFLYPLTFTLRDVIHQATDKKTAHICIWTAVLVNLFMAVYFWFVGFFAPDMSVPTSAYFDMVLSPVWRIVVFSLLAQLASELIDTQIYHRYTIKFGEKHKWGRVLVSNVVSVPIDNFIFCYGAFSFTYSQSVVFQIFMFNIVLKYVLSLVALPLIYVFSNPNNKKKCF